MALNFGTLADTTARSPLGRHLNWIAERVDNDCARFRMPFAEHNVTVGNMVHGGAISALADAAATAACWATPEAAPDSRGATVALNVNFLKAALGTDLVADARAPTPSAAAERVVLDGGDVRRRIAGSRTRMAASLRRLVEVRRRDVEYGREALRSCLEDRLERQDARLGRAADRLQALSPLAALGRGYAVAQDAEGRVLRGTGAFNAGDRFRLRVSDGRIDCRVEGVERDGDA